MWCRRLACLRLQAGRLHHKGFVRWSLASAPAGPRLPKRGPRGGRRETKTPDTKRTTELRCPRPRRTTRTSRRRSRTTAPTSPRPAVSPSGRFRRVRSPRSRARGRSRRCPAEARGPEAGATRPAEEADPGQEPLHPHRRQHASTRQEARRPRLPRRGPARERSTRTCATSEQPLGELAVERGLLNEDQLLQATAEVHGMRVANLEDVKPTPEAIKLVTEEHGRAVQDRAAHLRERHRSPSRCPTRTTCRRWTTCGTCSASRRSAPCSARPSRSTALLARAYSNEKEESITSVYRADRGGREHRHERDGPRDVHRPRRREEMANAAPVRKLINMVLLMAHPRPGLGHPLRAVRGRVQDARTGATACCTRWCRRRATSRPPSPAASRSWRTSTSPSGACRRTAASS